MTDNYDLGRYGQLTLSENGKLWQFTHLYPPSVSGYATYLAGLALRSIILDDGDTDAKPGYHLLPRHGLDRAQHRARGRHGDRPHRGARSCFTAYQVQPVGQVDFTPVNPRPTTPPAVGGNVKVGAFNTLNFFVTTGDGYTCGPYSTLQCRGAEQRRRVHAAAR